MFKFDFDLVSPLHRSQSGPSLDQALIYAHPPGRARRRVSDWIEADQRRVEQGQWRG